ncbi:probable serine/threonine-protein kinase nek3 isoform X2 [Anastrepha ludens]|uniref:probable serine/threonine-protein kinase nek3 isoform X2 n=1 Tax=Anastrepha ludens TaxID=28586 RepID=UPI0023B11A42|nr:probable serine/threonine-protein kinase nek3 isoform X2 [Anastrepha ludens]
MSNQFRLLLFIVVISGALCTVEDYVIMSQCAHNKAIHVAAEGTVSVTDISQTQNITIVGLPDYVNNNLKIALYAKETQRYLCFNDQWKLVGMKELRDTCYFNETIVHGYFVFRSVVDLQRRVGFTHRGKAVGPKKNVNDACYLFTKIQADQFFHQHTNYFAPKAKSTKTISGISTSPQTTATTTHTTSGASARLSSQRAALSAAATTATATATATASQRSHNNKLLRNNNKNKRVNGMRNNNKTNSNRNSNNNQNEEYSNGHSSNLSSNSNNNNPSSSHNSNSSKLVSNSQQQQQQIVVSQQKHHNYNNNTNNNNNSNSRTREHVRQQQQHQVRHHHNDPNLIARRQQHEHKQKRRQHQRQQQQRLRSGKITSPATTTEAQKAAQEHASATPTLAGRGAAMATTTQTTFSATVAAAGAALTGSYKQRKHENGAHTTAANVAEKGAAATTTTITTMKTTTIANKRKGRRRKGRKQNNQQQQQKLEQQMLPLRSQPFTFKSQESRHDAATPTQTTWLWNESPTSPLSSLSTSQISLAATYGDYSGEWISSTTLADSAAAPSSATTLLDAYIASSVSLLPSSVSSDTEDTPTHAYSASTTDVFDGFSSFTPTSDYNNITDFSGEILVDEDALNSTLIAEMDDSKTDIQLNSITSQQQHFITLSGAGSETEEQSLTSTSPIFSENSVQSWSPTTLDTEATAASFSDYAETMFPTPTATIETESVAATAILPEDVNATMETQTNADDADLYATMNSTSSETESESSSSSGSFTEALADVGSTITTAVVQRGSYNLKGEHENIINDPKINDSHMSRKPSSIAASIATLLYNQLLATRSNSDNEYAWRPLRGEEYSDEVDAATVRPTIATTTTDFAADDRATWWQHQMNHSGNNFWDKGLADAPPSVQSSDYSLHKHNKHRNRSKNRPNSRNGDSRDFEAVSQHPLQALLASNSSLSYTKKYLGEGKLQRQGSKSYGNSNKLQPQSAQTAQEYSYSSTIATTHSATATIKTQDATNATTVSATTTRQHIYPLHQLLGNKTIAPFNSQPQLLQFDGNSNHLVHTPTANTFVKTTSSTAPSSSTVASDSTPTAAAAAAAVTTKKTIRISTQKLLATPFHQLTYVRNNAGDIDIDNIDNISVYPDLLEESSEVAQQQSTERVATDATRNSRLTIVSGYLPTSATAMLPESIRLAKVKINKERKRMMSLRQRHGRRHA